MGSDFDVLIVGAGLSGVGMACHLAMRCPGKRYAILEARDAIGGTWDLFRYPGIRSDSDMYTLGYVFRPWREAKAIADGPTIRAYIEETARDHGVTEHIRFGHKVIRASWSSAEGRWTVEAEHEGEARRFTCRFLVMGSGYYDYGGGYRPEFPGEEAFAGRLVHPQSWPSDLDHAGKRVVVIGSGATAVTLVPEMAKTAARVTMLQRSPSYVVSRPAVDRVAEALKRVLPATLAYRLARLKNVALQMAFYRLARGRPAKVKAKMIDMVRAELGPDYDVETHFTPRYAPWDQRVCLVPDGDLFAAIREGKAEVETGEIDRFTPGGIRLRSGREIPADIVVTATGLRISLMGGAALFVDGVRQDLAERLAYKAIMFSGVPNMAFIFGYTNASWTLKADLAADYVCRLINHMDEKGHVSATPVAGPEVAPIPFLDFTSGYVRRALPLLPRQGDRKPWRLYQNYALDALTLKLGAIEDGALRFAR
ncbi:MAG: NAD(P)/FAD-dependent oxidoreductase [Alphaproteobacteria bacterium]|nr:NAD(P)/FAD-dependent oxidoreductase [Alphaproteobacteria bacterium]MBV9372095.1 NAD(P)/FAD-dependent oxidoreductase [Alphaproteobacteria bacterium]MBV9901736.1 NAD(P)/FAD-dependent oxidoreductase [Alphaproteobacteria bacterium]